LFVSLSLDTLYTPNPYLRNIESDLSSAEVMEEGKVGGSSIAGGENRRRLRRLKGAKAEYLRTCQKTIVDLLSEFLPC
jgi:hypothetical protein